MFGKSFGIKQPPTPSLHAAGLTGHPVPPETPVSPWTLCHRNHRALDGIAREMSVGGLDIMTATAIETETETELGTRTETGGTETEIEQETGIGKRTKIEITTSTASAAAPHPHLPLTSQNAPVSPATTTRERARSLYVMATPPSRPNPPRLGTTSSQLARATKRTLLARKNTAQKRARRRSSASGTWASLRAAASSANTTCWTTGNKDGARDSNQGRRRGCPMSTGTPVTTSLRCTCFAFDVKCRSTM